MEDIYDTLLFDDTPTEQPSVRRTLDEDPELARAWAHWCAVRARIRDRLNDQVPECRLLVLYALETAGRDSALSEAEQEALAASRDEIERALEAVPALAQVVESIQDDQEAFDAAWATQMDGAGAAHRGPETTSRSAERTERAPRPSGRRSRSDLYQWTRRAAVAALLIGVAVLATMYWPQDEALTTVTVDEGERRVVDLADGTTVRLAGGATLSYPSNLSDAEARRVTLREGRAFFDVQRRAEGRSFAVETPTATATVLGTQFGVLTGADTTAVVLAEGQVEVGARDEPSASVTLEPGQRSRVQRGQVPASPTSVNLTTTLDWTGLLVFRSTPMGTLAEQLQRHYDGTISVASVLQDEPVSGTFEQEQSLEEVLGTLAKTLNAEVQSTAEGQYQLVPKR